MFDWLSDIFNEDTFKTIVNGANTAGSIFNQLSPIINTGAQLALGLEGTGNAKAFNEANAAAQQKLDSLFGPTSDYAKELRTQLERKDAAAGRRSQYGTRETELMSKLAKEKASVLTSPAYANFLRNQFISPYAPIAGAVGNLTGGTVGAGAPGGRAQTQQGGGRNIPSTPGLSEAGQYLYSMFGPGAEAAIASGIGGAGSALAGANTPAALGVVDSLGSMLGGSPFLPGYAGNASGIFGPALGGAGGAGEAAAGSSAGEGLLGDLGGALGGMSDIIGAGLGGAGSALSGMGAGSLAGTVGGLDSLGALAGGTGFLPSYGAAGGASASGIFGGGASGLGAGAGSSGAGAGAGGLGGFGAAAGAALPIAVLLGGLASMFQPGTSPGDISQQWSSGLAQDASTKLMDPEAFGRFRAEQPHLNALLDLSTQGGQFDFNKYQDALNKSTVGGKHFEGDALNNALLFGRTYANNPNMWNVPAYQPEQFTNIGQYGSYQDGG